MNRLSTSERARVIAAWFEGCGVNATARLTGVSKPTILKLLRDLGCACAAYHHTHVCGLKPERIECDETWAFCYSKQKNVPEHLRGLYGFGDVWTWTAIDPETKLIVSYLVGLRSPDDAREFMLDLAGRITNMTQLTTDGLGSYPKAVRNAFGTEVHYAQLVKVYKTDRADHARYSPAECVGCKKENIIGAPDHAHVSTSIVERNNLTMRMSLRRFTRLTNGHSKKIENPGHAISVFFMYYNCCRKHATIGTSPAVAAGLADHVWTLDELLGILD